MKLKNLNEDETEIVRSCLECVADGNVILHDREFQTTMGVEAEWFVAMFAKWPEIDESDMNTRIAINNALNNLLGYPHDFHDKWEVVMDTPLAEIDRNFQKWRGVYNDATDGKQYFDGLM